MLFRNLMLAACLCVPTFLTGCGGGGTYADGVKTGTVSGTVTFQGNPIPEGATISFLAEGGTGVPAVGSIGSDGSFRLRAKGTFDLPVGIYKVSVTPAPAVTMTDEEAMQASIEGRLQDTDVKEVPQKYRSAETSGEVFEVKEGSNEYTLDMQP